MVACTLGRLCQQFVANRMDVQPAPKVLQVIEPVAELFRGQTPSLAHSR